MYVCKTCMSQQKFNFAEEGFEKIDFSWIFFCSINSNHLVTMSARNNKKSFVCPVCHDTTLDGQVNHWVRNQNGGGVVCPTLLGIACGVCGDCSHTTKKCLQKKREDRARRRSMYMSVVSSEYISEVNKSGVISGVNKSEVNKSEVDHNRKVEELKRISADTPPTIIENKKKEVRRVFYS